MKYYMIEQWMPFYEGDIFTLKAGDENSAKLEAIQEYNHLRPSEIDRLAAIMVLDEINKIRFENGDDFDTVMDVRA